jgi:hypothetical protein
MVTTDVVPRRFPTLAAQVEAVLSYGIILGQEIRPTIFFENEEGDVAACLTLEEVSLEEIVGDAQLLADEVGASATVACWPALVDCDGGEAYTIVVVTQDHLAKETSIAFCVVEEDEETGVCSIEVFDLDRYSEAARS